MTQEQLRMQFLAGLITEDQYLSEIKTISKGQKIEYAKGKQPVKTAYMVEYSDHSYNQDYCVVTDSEENLENKDSYFLISKRWIK